MGEADMLEGEGGVGRRKRRGGGHGCCKELV